MLVDYPFVYFYLDMLSKLDDSVATATASDDLDHKMVCKMNHHGIEAKQNLEQPCSLADTHTPKGRDQRRAMTFNVKGHALSLCLG
jgi:hypothetical protein